MTNSQEQNIKAALLRAIKLHNLGFVITGSGTGEEIVRVYANSGHKYLGWIQLIEGNGRDLISDWSANLGEFVPYLNESR